MEFYFIENNFILLEISRQEALAVPSECSRTIKNAEVLS